MRSRRRLRQGLRADATTLTVLCLLAAALMYADVREAEGEPGILTGTRAVVADATAPLQEGVAALPDMVDAVRGRVAGTPEDTRRRISELERSNDGLRAAGRATEYDRNRAAELDRLLRVSGAGQYRTVPARVIAFGPVDGFSRTVTIDAGRLDGLTDNLTVINGAGLIGRVVAVAEKTSTVALLIDSSTTVGVRLENMQAGFARGSGGRVDAPLTVELLNPSAPVRPGDRLVTFGSPDGVPYVAGVPVGTVTTVEGITPALTKRIFVEPYVDFGALDLVGVVVEPPRRDPRTSVLPPVPTAPAPAPNTSTVPVPAREPEPDGDVRS